MTPQATFHGISSLLWGIGYFTFYTPGCRVVCLSSPHGPFNSGGVFPTQAPPGVHPAVVQGFSSDYPCRRPGGVSPTQASPDDHSVTSVLALLRCRFNYYPALQGSLSEISLVHPGEVSQPPPVIFSLFKSCPFSSNLSVAFR